MFRFYSDTVFDVARSNVEFFMLNFYVPFSENALFYVALIKIIFKKEIG